MQIYSLTTTVMSELQYVGYHQYLTITSIHAKKKSTNKEKKTLTMTKVKLTSSNLLNHLTPIIL